MKLIQVITAATACLMGVLLLVEAAPAEAATLKRRDCHGHRNYCGARLNDIGWTNKMIREGLRKGDGDYPDELILPSQNWTHTLFECKARTFKQDNLLYIATCPPGSCVYGGKHDSDYCGIVWSSADSASDNE